MLMLQDPAQPVRAGHTACSRAWTQPVCCFWCGWVSFHLQSARCCPAAAVFQRIQHPSCLSPESRMLACLHRWRKVKAENAARMSAKMSLHLACLIWQAHGWLSLRCRLSQQRLSSSSSMTAHICHEHEFSSAGPRILLPLLMNGWCALT